MGTNRRVRGPVLFGLLLAAALGAGGTRAATALEIGKSAPDFTLPSTTGEEIILSQFRGKLVLTVGALLAGLVADWLVMAAAIHVVAGRRRHGEMRETLGASR